MIKITEESLAQIRAIPILCDQLENIIADFSEGVGELKFPDEDGGRLASSLFIFYCFGMMSVINPGSNFNSKYNRGGPEVKNEATK